MYWKGVWGSRMFSIFSLAQETNRNDEEFLGSFAGSCVLREGLLHPGKIIIAHYYLNFPPRTSYPNPQPPKKRCAKQ